MRTWNELSGHRIEVLEGQRRCSGVRSAHRHLQIARYGSDTYPFASERIRLTNVSPLSPFHCTCVCCRCSTAKPSAVTLSPLTIRPSLQVLPVQSTCVASAPWSARHIEIDAAEYLPSVVRKRPGGMTVELERQPGIVLKAAGDPKPWVDLIANAPAACIALVPFFRAASCSM